MRTRHLLLATAANADARHRSARFGGGYQHVDHRAGRVPFDQRAADAGNLGTRANTVAGGTISGPWARCRSTTRAAPPPVRAGSRASSPPRSPRRPGPAIAASAVGYTAGTITKVGTATYTANDPADLTGVAPAVTATGITGDNSATWNPTINVAVPGGMAAGVYSATITHSVS